MNLTADLASVVDDKNNNFNLLRFGAALAVIVSHSFILSDNTPNSLPKIIGFLAVNCFFIISGFLVCKSLLQRNSLLSFCLARVLRIYPALILAVLFCAFIIGPLHTSLPLADYLTSSQTYRFILTNATLLGGSVDYSLPGVFRIGDSGSKVNAPLWTLFFELYMYICLAILALICGFRSNFKVKSFGVVIYLVTIILFVIFITDIGYKFIQSDFISNMVRFAALFGMGAALYLARTKIKLSPLVLLIMLLVIAVASLNRLTFNGLFYFFLGYILLYLAYIPKGLLLKFNKLGDYSYGLYIFAYPIQQSFVHWYPTISTFSLLFFSFLLSLAIAILLWHFIESRALTYKV